MLEGRMSKDLRRQGGSQSLSCNDSETRKEKELAPLPTVSSGSRHRWVTALWPYLLLMVPPLCWGGNAVLARGVVDIIPPISLSFWRWFVAFAVLYPFTYRRVREDWGTALRSWKWMLAISFLGISSFNSFLYKAAHTTTAINIAMIQTIMPAVIIVISFALYKERVRLIQMVGVILSIGGACYVLLRGEWKTLLSMSFLEGDLLMLIAVVVYALYSVLLRKRPGIHPLSFGTLTFAWGTLLLLPFYLWELFSIGTFHLGYAEIMSILYVGIFPSTIAYLCWNRGVELIGANRAGLFVNLVPLFASVLAVLLLGESLKGFHLVGLALIFGGMAIFNTLKSS